MDQRSPDLPFRLEQRAHRLWPLDLERLVAEGEKDPAGTQRLCDPASCDCRVHPVEGGRREGRVDVLGQGGGFRRRGISCPAEGAQRRQEVRACPLLRLRLGLEDTGQKSCRPVRGSGHRRIEVPTFRHKL